MKNILSRLGAMLAVGLCLACSTKSAQPAACPSVEVDAVTDAHADSTRHVALNDSTTISVARTPLLTSADITSADAASNGGEWMVNATMTDAAAKRVQEYTTANVGRTLVTLVDGKVVGGTPRIAGPITGKGFMVGGFPQAEAERLATAMRNGCHA